MQQIRDNSGNLLWLVDIPADGDCLFGSIVHQLYEITPKHPLFKSYSQQVRENAVSEMRRNLHLYSDTVTSYAVELITLNCSVAEKVELYLNRMLTAGYWGGADSIAALANHYNVVFVIYHDEYKIEFTPTHSEVGILSRYNLFYWNCRYFDETSGEEYMKIHYDSILCIRMFGASLDCSDAQTFQLPGSPSDMRVKMFGSDPNAIFYTILHQLTGVISSEEDIGLLRGLVADEIENRPYSFLSSCGVPCDTVDAVSQFTFELRAGRNDDGTATLLVLSAVMKITIFVHSDSQGILRYDPVGGTPSLSIQLLKDRSSSVVRYGSVLVSEHGPSRLPTVRRTLPDPMVIARKVSRNEQTDSQSTNHPALSVDPKKGLRFASININGCRSEDKREAIDALLFSQRVQIAVLQEVNLDCQYVATTLIISGI